MAANQQVLCLLLSLTALTAASASASTSAPASTRFIHTSCSFTLYPDVCFASLSGYANAVQQNPVQLSLAAANVSMAHVRAVLTHVTSLRSSSEKEAGALRDCCSVLADAAERTRRAAAELAALEAAVGEEVALRVENAQTWMSAALTNEEACTGGFEGVGKSGVGSDVCGRVGSAKQFTSNALALVNHLVNSG